MSEACDSYTAHAFKKDVCAGCFLGKAVHQEFGGSGVKETVNEDKKPQERGRGVSFTGGKGITTGVSNKSKEKVKEFTELTELPYKEQAQWFLNGFWTMVEGDAEFIWSVVQLCHELDTKDKEKGCSLDEFSSHRLLEKFDDSMTVVTMREALKEIDVTCDAKMSVLEYLVWKYSVGVDQTVDSPQGDNEAEIHKAQQNIIQVQALLFEVQEKLEAQKEAVALVQAEEVSLNALQKELEAAIAEMDAQQAAYDKKKGELEIKKEDENLGVVTRNKAANELEQMLAEDPLPLRRAKITQEAALRKVNKQKAVVEKAREEAEKRESELQASYDDLATKMEEAQAALQEIKLKGGGIAYGNIWWMERELEEADKYLPPNKRRKK